MAYKTRIKGKNVNVHNDGEIFVNGTSAGFKQWKSGSTRYSNMSGQEIKKIKGKDLETALTIMGKLWFLCPQKKRPAFVLGFQFTGFVDSIRNYSSNPLFLTEFTRVTLDFWGPRGRYSKLNHVSVIKWTLFSID